MLTMCVLVCLAVASAAPQFNNTKCPAFWELQAPHVPTDFALDELPGLYYELALHDVTQYPLCPSKPACISSGKAIQSHSDGVRFVNDTWNLYCLGKYYPQTLLFNVTDHPGYFEGYVPVTKIPFLPPKVVASLVFPDTVVDFKSGPEGWALEFQCVEFKGHVVFVGINFYSKTKTKAAYDEMYKAGVAAGIDFYWNQHRGLTPVNQTGCPSP